MKCFVLLCNVHSIWTAGGAGRNTAFRVLSCCSGETKTLIVKKTCFKGVHYYYVKNFSDLLLSWRKQSKRLVSLASKLTSVLYTPYYCSCFIEKLLLSWSSLQSTLRSALTTFTKISDKCYDHIHTTFKISESIQAQRNLIAVFSIAIHQNTILTLQSPSCSRTSQYTGCILKPVTTAYI